MTTIAVAADLHFDRAGHLTAPEKVSSVAKAIRCAEPDAVVLAGDIGHPLDNFVGCIDLFADWPTPVGIVAGNHDVWRDAGHSSRELWEDLLPKVTRSRNCVWLESDTIRIEDIAIVGTIAWYDYSAIEPSLKLTSAYVRQLKAKISNDARWVDWPWRDGRFANVVREGLVLRLQKLQEDDTVSRIVVVTHVPLFEQQMQRDPSDVVLSLASAYFGNLNTGREVASFSKVVAVVSGHLHQQRHVVVPRDGMVDLHAVVVGSDYGRPSWIKLEL